MKLTPVILDYESFWSVEHTLTKMNPIDYVMHPETEIISLAYCFGDDPVHVIFGEDKIRAWAKAVDWSDKLVIAHNNEGFDSMISAWRFGIKPKMWGCTLAMARPIHAKSAGGSLRKLADHYQLQAKGDLEKTNTKGKHLSEFTSSELRDMREYNKIDTEICRSLFRILLPLTSKDEMRLIDMTIRMLVEPQFEVDAPMLEKALAEEKERKHLLLLDTATMVGADVVGMTDEEIAFNISKTLGSAQKFAKLLTDLGVAPPMKISPTTGKETYALAKTDEQFTALTTHHDPIVAAAASARLGVKSSILETRIEAFLDASRAAGGKLPVPLKYYGADTTGRWSGWGYNPQNLPRVSGKPSDCLRMSLRAPRGYKIVVADLSGIELRVNHFLWKVPSSMALFEASPGKADLYRHFASTLYGVPVDGVSKEQRQVGKVCIAEGTLVYCLHQSRKFWCPIEGVKPEYQLWDGEEWVWAKGVVSNGWKKTQRLCGVSLTPDHLVLCGTTWQEAQYVRGEKTALALATGAENLSLPDMLRATGVASPHLLLSATAGFLSTRLRQTTSALSKQLGATTVRSNPPGLLESCTGGTPKLCPKIVTERGCLTGFLRQLRGAITRTIARMRTMVAEVSTCAASGVLTGLRFFGMSGLCPDGTPPSLRWIGSTLTAVTTTVTFGSSAAEKTCSTNAESKTLSAKSLTSKRVYDILNCGPRNRFTILSNKGPLVVHNCHLGLGFGAGGATFQKVAKLMAGIQLSVDEANDVVAKWRAAYPEIVAGWKTCHGALSAIYGDASYDIDPWGMCHTSSEGIVTPKGLIRYPNLRQEHTDEGKKEWVYGEGRNKARIYAGKVTENIVQHLARCIIADNALAVKKETGQLPCLTVHDELVYVVREELAENHLAVVQRTMRTPPHWWPDLVTWSEGGIADTYGEAK